LGDGPARSHFQIRGLNLNLSPNISRTRTAGWLYLVLAVTGGFSMLYVPSLVVPGNASATVANILAYESLFRLGIVSGLACQVVFVFLGLALYRLFRVVSEKRAAVMKALVMAAVPVGFLNVLNLIAALRFAQGDGYLVTLDDTQRSMWTMFFLDLYAQGLAIVGIFWGLWLLPLGLLVVKSRFMPAFLGWLLVIACGGYMVDVLTRLLLPGAAASLSPITGLAKFGEVVMILWLLIRGIQETPPET